VDRSAAGHFAVPGPGHKKESGNGGGRRNGDKNRPPNPTGGPQDLPGVDDFLAAILALSQMQLDLPQRFPLQLMTEVSDELVIRRMGEV
jgi:hypothetical protein